MFFLSSRKHGFTPEAIEQNLWNSDADQTLKPGDVLQDNFYADNILNMNLNFYKSASTKSLGSNCWRSSTPSPIPI